MSFIRYLVVLPIFFGLFILSCFALGYAKTPATPDLTANPSAIDSGDTAWMLTSSALVMLMSFPGLALFYGGQVKTKDALNTMAMTCITYCIVSVLWILYGYSLAFGPDHVGIIGDTSKLFMHSVGPYSTSSLAPTIPEYVYCVFQLTFSAITVALASGGYAGRIKFTAWTMFSVLWMTIVYLPIAHWVWGNGFLMTWGVLDFAGGTVVHISSGVAALVGSVLLGPRHDKKTEPGNMTLVVIGTGLLWFGWFGFNAGSACSSGPLAASAWINTNTATATGAMVWMLAEYKHTSKHTLYGLCSGAISGLVAITPASGFVNVAGAVIIGLFSGLLPYYFVILLKPKLGYDDALDAFSVHAISGALGAILTGILADANINSGGNGFIYTGYSQLWKQVVGVLITSSYSAVMTAVIFYIIKYSLGIRVSKEDEEIGMDASQHNEKAYHLNTLTRANSDRFFVEPNPNAVSP